MHVGVIYPKNEDAVGAWVGKAGVYVMKREGIVIAKIPEKDQKAEIYLYIDQDDKIFLQRADSEGKLHRAEVSPEAYERHILTMLEGMVSEIKLTPVDVKEVIN